MSGTLFDLKGQSVTTPIPSGAVLFGAVADDASAPALFDASSLVAQSDAYTTPQSHGAVADGVTDDLAAFVAAFATGKTVLVPAGTYALTNYIEPASNQHVIGLGKPTLKMIGNSRWLRIASKTGVVVKNFNVDCTTDGLTSTGGVFMSQCTHCVVEDVTLTKQYGTWFITGSSAAYNRLTRIRIVDARNVNGITLDGGASFNTVEHCLFTNTTRHTGTFNGLRGSNGTHHNFLLFNRGFGLGGELVAFERSTYSDQIIGNYVEWSGDNGISYTGEAGVINDNVCKYNDFSGIYLYGERSTCTGNQCIGNGQAGGNHPGINVGGFWGGLGIYHCVTGNVCDDDQTSMTQYCSIKLNGTGYQEWTASDTISSATTTYRLYGQNLYKASTTGATGATAPTHTSGTVSDGGVSWEYIDTYPSSRETYRCTIVGNKNIRSVTGTGVLDETINQANLILRDGNIELVGDGGVNVLTGGVKTRGTIWTNGEAVKWGMFRYNNSPHLYVCTNAGGTASVIPTHTSGKFTGADGIEWRYVAGSTQRFELFEIIESGMRIGGELRLQSPESSTDYGSIVAGVGSPEGEVTASKPMLFMSSSGLYFNTGTGATGWVAK